jgi:hypothetical protein
MRRDILRVPGLVLSVVLTAAHPGSSQEVPGSSPGPFARIVTIEPKAAQEAAFEAGYQRHLAWHRGQHDSWTWYGWSFVLGERLGLFMDGTFGHAPADFDHAVNPAGDGADNAVNVVPNADFRSHGVYERLTAVSSSAALPDTSRLLALTTYWVRPGQEAQFEALLATTHAAWRRVPQPAPPYAWFRLGLGGSPPEYLLLRPVASFASAAVLPDIFAVGAGTVRASSAVSRDPLLASVIRVRSELLRYRPDMSYHP